MGRGDDMPLMKRARERPLKMRLDLSRTLLLETVEGPFTHTRPVLDTTDTDTGHSAHPGFDHVMD